MLLLHRNPGTGNQQGQDLLPKKGDEHYMFLCACLISCLVNATVEIIIEMNNLLNIFIGLQAKVVFSSL